MSKEGKKENMSGYNKKNWIGYYGRIVSQLRFKRFNEVLKNAHDRSGKSKVSIFFDMVNCFIKYKAGYQDYVIFELWDVPKEKRGTYLTRFKSKKFVTFMNDDSFTYLFDDKSAFNIKFKDYIGREFIDLEKASVEEVETYFNSRAKSFAKIKDASGGAGCALILHSDYKDSKEYSEYLLKNNYTTIEDVIENHPEVGKLHPSSINTLRTITFLDAKGEAHVVFAVFKMGRDGRVVDNYGLHGPVDLETGKFIYPAHSGDTKAGQHYTKHPNTGYEIIGFEIPYFQELKELAKQAAKVVPEVRYVGWDIAITPTGPVIIEGNNYCAHDFWQLPGQREDEIGIIPVINELIPEMKW